MRLSATLMGVSAAGVLGGAWLCGLLAFGITVMCVSLAVGVYGLLRETGDRPAPSVHEVPTLAQVLEKARHAS
jgi:hypothetical protein